MAIDLTNPNLQFGDYDILGFPNNPFFDDPIEGQVVSLDSVFKWCEYFWNRTDFVSQAIRNVIAYFITDYDIPDISSEKRMAYKTALDQQAGIPQALMKYGETMMTYGISFMVPSMPFIRFLTCQNCGTIVAMDPVEPVDKLEFDGDTGQLVGKCPKCSHHGRMIRTDSAIRDLRKIRFMQLTPYEIEIDYNSISGDKVFYRKVPNDVISGLQKSNPFYLATTPAMYFKIFQKGGQPRQQLAIWNNDNFFSSAFEPPSGICLNGWGWPPLMNSIYSIWKHQLVERQEAALAIDSLTPIRIFSPPKGTQFDPIATEGIASFEAKVQNILQVHRQNPQSSHALPYALEYNAYGGDGKSLWTADIKALSLETILNGIGVPVDFFKRTLTTQAAPLSLRLMEQAWSPLTQNMNQALQWMVGKIVRRMRWDNIKIALQKTTIADDIERKQLIYNMAMAKMISNTTLLEMLGFDSYEELKKILGEEQARNIAVMRQQADMMAQENVTLAQEAGTPTPSMGGMGAGMAAGGMPAPMMPDDMAGGAGGAGGSSPSVMQLEAQAMQMAQVLASMPPGSPDRVSQLRNLSSQNPTLHALVKDRLSAIEQNMAMQGREAVRGG